MSEYDEIARQCPHDTSFILWTRYCTECCTILEEDVVTPGTETVTHHCQLVVKP